MFAYYSTQLGCLGSIAVSVIGTIVLGAILWSCSAY